MGAVVMRRKPPSSSTVTVAGAGGGDAVDPEGALGGPERPHTGVVEPLYAPPEEARVRQVGRRPLIVGRRTEEIHVCRDEGAQRITHFDDGPHRLGRVRRERVVQLAGARAPPAVDSREGSGHTGGRPRSTGEQQKGERDARGNQWLEAYSRKAGDRFWRLSHTSRSRGPSLSP